MKSTPNAPWQAQSQVCCLAWRRFLPLCLEPSGNGRAGRYTTWSGKVLYCGDFPPTEYEAAARLSATGTQRHTYGKKR